MDNKIAYGIIGALTLILAGIGSQYLTQDQYDKSYICNTTQQIILPERLSSTNKTVYWTENNITKSKSCTNGVWIQLKKYTIENMKTINIIPAEAATARQYLCNNIKCVVKT